MATRGTLIEVNRALLRPILFCGAERRSTIIYGTISMAVAAASNFKSPGIYLGPLLFVGCHLFFVWIAKMDPQMIAVYSRHIRYKQAFYPAKSGASVNPETAFIRATIGKKK